MRAILHQDGVIGKAKDISMTTHAPALLVAEYGPVFWPIIAEAWLRLYGRAGSLRIRQFI
jgi:hypothetical protein